MTKNLGEIQKLQKFVLTQDKDLIELANALNRIQGKLNQVVDVVNEIRQEIRASSND